MSHLRLDDLLARDVAVEWFEGVAVLQLTCRALGAQGRSGSGFPSAADILVGPGGSIAINGQQAGDGVQAAAHLLARMLSEDVPVPAAGGESGDGHAERVCEPDRIFGGAGVLRTSRS